MARKSVGASWAAKRFRIPHQKAKILPKLSEAVTIYCDLKHKSEDKRFVRFTQCVVGEVVACAGDKAING